MPSTKRTVKRAGVKIWRRILGPGKKYAMVDKVAGTGMTGTEIKDVLGVIGRHKAELPPMTYEYRPPIRFLTKEMLYLKPESGKKAGSLAIKLRKVLGARYRVDAF